MSQTDALDRGGYRNTNLTLTRLAPESWKSASVQKALQTSALHSAGPKEVEMELHSTSNGILEVCECTKSVADRCIGLGTVPGTRI